MPLAQFRFAAHGFRLVRLTHWVITWYFRAVRLLLSTLDRDAQRGRISRYTSRFMITRLLFLVEGHRVDRLTFGVLASRGGCPCFSIGRQNDGDDSRRFSILLEGEARSRRVDPR